MNILDQIENYIPFNNKEENDKKLFINFIKSNNEIYSRNNLSGHITSSCWIINEKHNKVLMCYHNIYDSYSWLGGHNDGDENCLNVAIKELKEESGLKKYKVLDKSIFSLEVLPVKEHIKNGKTIKKHLHYNVTFLFECDEKEELKTKSDENSNLKWFKIRDLKSNVREVEMYSDVYLKLINKCKNIGWL